MTELHQQLIAEIAPAIQRYRAEAQDDPDWWWSVPAAGYQHGVDVNIHYDEDGKGGEFDLSTRRASVYPNIQKPGDLFLHTDTTQCLAVIPEAEWPAG